MNGFSNRLHKVFKNRQLFVLETSELFKNISASRRFSHLDYILRESKILQDFKWICKIKLISFVTYPLLSGTLTGNGEKRTKSTGKA